MKNILQPMTDFVLHLHSMTTSELCKEYPNRFKMPSGVDKDNLVKQLLAIDTIKWDMVKEYAKFLKQPLTLSMFVPVSESAEALQKPENYEVWKKLHLSEGSTIGFLEHEKYYQSESKVLFNGIESKEVKSLSIILTNGDFTITYVGGTFEDESDYKTLYVVEDLCKLDLTLSETALKQIYG